MKIIIDVPYGEYCERCGALETYENARPPWARCLVFEKESLRGDLIPNKSSMMIHWLKCQQCINAEVKDEI